MCLISRMIVSNFESCRLRLRRSNCLVCETAGGRNRTAPPDSESVDAFNGDRLTLANFKIDGLVVATNGTGFARIGVNGRRDQLSILPFQVYLKAASGT